MSWQATAWVSTVEAGGASGKLLLYALANYADENGRTFAGDERIMRDTELSERSVRDWKRRLEEAGLIHVERRRRPGGNFDVDVIVLAMDCQQPPANSAGGEDAATTGKSCRDHRQMTPPPPANGSIPPAPPYKAEQSIEPPVEPNEREAQARGQEGQTETAESRKAVERAFDRAWRDWPPVVAGSRPEALKIWWTLTPDERDAARAAVVRWLAAWKAEGRERVPALSTYLRDKRWENLPPPPSEHKPIALEAAAFGPKWMAKRLWQFEMVAPVRPAPLTATQRRMVDEGLASEGELMRAKQARDGWPEVNRMHERARFGQGVTVAPELEALAALMEPVPVGSERYAEWEVEHERRGWPWLPDPGAQRVVFFPAGGPGEGMRRFEQAVRGEDDAGERRAVGA